jgi:hypothetical protein
MHEKTFWALAVAWVILLNISVVGQEQPNTRGQRQGVQSVKPASGAQVCSRLTAQGTKDDCQPCQHKDRNDRCVDDSDCKHYPEGHEPGSDEQCWVVTKCLCREGEYPRGESCSPCSYAGKEVVCKPR